MVMGFQPKLGGVIKILFFAKILINQAKLNSYPYSASINIHFAQK